MTAPDPDRLNELGKRVDEAQQRLTARDKRPAPSPLGIAGRLTTDLVAGVVVGGGLGWGIDWSLAQAGYPTKPVFLIVFFMLGAAAGIRNVMRTANEINAKIAATSASKPEEK